MEKLEAKRALFKKIESLLNPQALVSSNTSALPWSTLVKDGENGFKQRFVITHFFNPPRYLKLVELVCGPECDEKLVSKLSSFLSERLGKGVLHAKDTPAFIANRIGIFHAMDVMHLAGEHSWPFESVDAVLGRPTGRPKTGIFKLMDVVGLDTVASVTETILKGCSDDESIARFRIPQYIQRMLVNGWTGNKAGCGFFKKSKDNGRIMALDPRTMQYREKVSFNTPILAETKSIRCVNSRIRNMVFSTDEASEIAWLIISRLLVYAANRIPEVCSDVKDVDRAMRWGFNWQLGPFETWDALGVRKVADRLESEGREVPALVEEMLSSGRESFYTSSVSIKTGKGRVEKNACASLVDTGDGIFACEFHSKMNAIGESTIKMLEISLERAEREGAGLLIANDGEHFSVGANLLAILDAIEKKRWDDIDKMVRSFQTISQRIRFSTKPVVAAPFGRTLGGACEFCMSSAARVAHIETYMGLVETAVGLIPAGGGCKNLLLKMEQRLGGGPGPKEHGAFELIATSRVSTSAREAMELGLISQHDSIVFDRDRLFSAARDKLLELAKDYTPPQPRTDIKASGNGGKNALINVVRAYLNKGLATKYDAYIAEKLAYVLSGGDKPCIHTTDEAHILDLEREAFLSLAGEERTKQRIAHMLKTNKPLRN
ncbi:MAG: 3-hydroxyacyl-CoA dehydrogenase NAD-binding domain-containing protein [Pseudomonadota bacterium]